MPRPVPAEVAADLQGVTGAATAIAAVARSRALHHSIARWQAALVREALDEGSTWEEIGEALGTTRQAAWARFRQAVEPEGGASAMNDRSELREQFRNLWREGQGRRREADARWREEQERLRSQLQESRDQLREARRRYAAERRAAREELRRSADALRSELSGAGR